MSKLNKEVHSCEGEVYNHEGTFNNKWLPCTNRGKVCRDGRWYCGIHDPVAIATKEAKRMARWEANKLAAKNKQERLNIIHGLTKDVPTEELAGCELVPRQLRVDVLAELEDTRAWLYNYCMNRGIDTGDGSRFDRLKKLIDKVRSNGR